MRYFSLFLLFSIFISCNSKPEFVKKKTPKFTIEVLSNLDETTILNEEAVLQFKNEFQELYLIVLEDSKENLFFYDGLNSNDPKIRVQSYAKIVLDNVEENIKLQNYTGYNLQNINGFEAVNFSFNGIDKESEENIFYYITIIDSPAAIYQVFSWTLFNKKEEHLKAIEKMTKSFKPFLSNLKLKKTTKK